MFNYLKPAALAFIFFLAAGSAHAGTWTLVEEESKVSFGSIKKNQVGEIHNFSGLSGTVTQDGHASVSIDVKSIETNIDKRNERMLKWVFDAAKPKITIQSKIDMKDISQLAVGATTTMDMDGELKINDTSIELEAELFVARLSEKRILVTSDGMIMLSTKALGIDKAIDMLKKVAKLPGITRVTPVSFRFVFKAD